MNDEYKKLDFKVPIESQDYMVCSDFVVNQIEAIIDDSILSGKNKIIINTNLKLGLPMENINKVAGPFVEAWAFEIFSDILDEKCIASHKGYTEWLRYANQNHWIKG